MKNLVFKFIFNVLFLLFVFWLSRHFFKIDNIIQVATVYIFSKTWGEIERYIFPEEDM